MMKEMSSIVSDETVTIIEETVRADGRLTLDNLIGLFPDISRSLLGDGMVRMQKTVRKGSTENAHVRTQTKSVNSSNAKENEGEEFLDLIVTRDKARACHYTYKSERQWLRRRHTTPEKFKITLSVYKVVGRNFLGPEGRGIRSSKWNNQFRGLLWKKTAEKYNSLSQEHVLRTGYCHPPPAPPSYGPEACVHWLSRFLLSFLGGKHFSDDDLLKKVCNLITRTGPSYKKHCFAARRRSDGPYLSFINILFPRASSGVLGGHVFISFLYLFRVLIFPCKSRRQTRTNDLYMLTGITRDTTSEEVVAGLVGGGDGEFVRNSSFDCTYMHTHTHNTSDVRRSPRRRRRFIGGRSGGLCLHWRFSEKVRARARSRADYPVARRAAAERRPKD